MRQVEISRTIVFVAPRHARVDESQPHEQHFVDGRDASS
jgi:hypothetical protein